jgi:hypothetical protein
MTMEVDEQSDGNSSSDNNVVSNDADNTNKPKASEKRKAQNRRAQATYRMKKKKRLEQLEELAKTMNEVNVMPPPSLTGLSTGTSTSPDTLDLSPPETFLPDAGSFGNLIDPIMAMHGDGGSLFATDGFSQVSTNFNFNPLPGPETTWVPLSTGWQTTALEVLTADGSTALTTTTPNSLSADGSPPTTTTKPSFPPAKMILPSSAISKDTLSNHERYSLMLQTRAVGRPSYAADPYANTLRLNQTTVCWAFFQNVLHLGLDENMCETDHQSPFYRPELFGMDNDVLIRGVQAEFQATIKKDLRPTKEQILIPHAGYIDILPWPDVRSRIIELNAQGDSSFDEDDFWHDIDSDGLVCWGTHSPRPGTLGGAPWDARSWEAKSWFLSKWSFVVGGEDGELGSNTRWWREMRGVNQGYG